MRILSSHPVPMKIWNTIRASSSLECGREVSQEGELGASVCEDEQKLVTASVGHSHFTNVYGYHFTSLVRVSCLQHVKAFSV